MVKEYRRWNKTWKLESVVWCLNFLVVHRQPLSLETIEPKLIFIWEELNRVIPATSHDVNFLKKKRFLQNIYIAPLETYDDSRPLIKKLNVHE